MRAVLNYKLEKQEDVLTLLYGTHCFLHQAHHPPYDIKTTNEILMLPFPI